MVPHMSRERKFLSELVLVFVKVGKLELSIRLRARDLFDDGER